MPWFERTEVWAVLVSILAIALSQLPPIRTWFASNKISVEVGSRIGLPNTVGISGFQVFLDLKNSGNRSVTVSKFILELTYPDSP
jgi:hypothetical protein